jgi:adenylosuccinate lyase
MERTLDDSSCRRLTLPEPFLALDGALDIVVNVVSGMVVYEKTVAANLNAELPFMATENLMMAAVKAGHDRQEIHEVIRTHSQAAALRVKAEGAPNDLLERLEQEPCFRGVNLRAELDGVRFVGRSPRQVEEFIAQVAEPIRVRYRTVLDYEAALKV